MESVLKPFKPFGKQKKGVTASRSARQSAPRQSQREMESAAAIAVKETEAEANACTLAMQNSTEYITNVLPADDIAVAMYSAGLLTAEKMEHYTAMRDSHETTKYKSLYLVQCVAGPTAVRKFCDVLDAQDSDQSKEIAEYIRGQIQQTRSLLAKQAHHHPLRTVATKNDQQHLYDNSAARNEGKMRLWRNIERHQQLYEQLQEKDDEIAKLEGQNTLLSLRIQNLQQTLEKVSRDNSELKQKLEAMDKHLQKFQGLITDSKAIVSSVLSRTKDSVKAFPHVTDTGSANSSEAELERKHRSHSQRAQTQNKRRTLYRSNSDSSISSLYVTHTGSEADSESTLPRPRSRSREYPRKSKRVLDIQKQTSLSTLYYSVASDGSDGTPRGSPMSARHSIVSELGYEPGAESMTSLVMTDALNKQDTLLPEEPTSQRLTELSNMDLESSPPIGLATTQAYSSSMVDDSKGPQAKLTTQASNADKTQAQTARNNINSVLRASSLPGHASHYSMSSTGESAFTGDDSTDERMLRWHEQNWAISHPESGQNDTPKATQKQFVYSVQPKTPMQPHQTKPLQGDPTFKQRLQRQREKSESGEPSLSFQELERTRNEGIARKEEPQVTNELKEILDKQKRRLHSSTA